MISERTKRKKIQSKYSKGDEDDEYDLEKLMKIANGQQMDDDEEKFTLYKIKKFRQQGNGRIANAEYMVDDIKQNDTALEAGAPKNARAFNGNGRKIGKKYSSKANVFGRESKAKGGITNILEDDEFKPRHRLTRKAQTSEGGS